MSNDNIESIDGYTYPEKLAFVSKGLMAPEEIGVATAEEAQALQVMPDAPKEAFLGDFCTFEVSEVPLKLRAVWAKQDNKILPFDEEKWMEENKETHVLQGRLRCGNVASMIEQTYSDVVGGFSSMLEGAAVILRKMKEAHDKGEFNPPKDKDPLIKQNEEREIRPSPDSTDGAAGSV